MCDSRLNEPPLLGYSYRKNNRIFEGFCGHIECRALFTGRVQRGTQRGTYSKGLK